MSTFISVVLALGVATSPAPAPSASATPGAAGPPPTPLREIGVTRARAICTPLVVHANGAITTALDNDRNLGIMIFNLRQTNFDNMNELQQRNAIEATMRMASKIREASSAGDAEVKRLREIADVTTDPERKKELRTFADALGGAIYRQKKAAVETMRDITIVQGRKEVQESGRIVSESTMGSIGGSNVPQSPFQSKSLGADMKAIAGALDERQPGILADEGVAADHAIAATSGC